MPYYPDINILFIHIPKTGGTSLEEFFSKKSSQQLFCYHAWNNVFPKETHLSKYSLQHQSLKDIEKYKELFPQIKFDKNLKIISVVRNPYNRIISDLKFYRILNSRDPDKIYDIIKKFVESPYEKYDNHNRPQYQYLMDEKNEIDSRVRIFRSETLTKNMHNYGFRDYQGKETSPEYLHLLNEESIKLINKVYDKDFEFFNYKKL